MIRIYTYFSMNNQLFSMPNEQFELIEQFERLNIKIVMFKKI